SRRRHTRSKRDWSSDVCSSDLQAKLTQYTRYMTLGLAVLNATTLVSTVRTGALFGNVEGCQDLILNDTWWGIGIIIVTMTAGTRSEERRVGKERGEGGAAVRRT